jgi:hypothetical protein
MQITIAAIALLVGILGLLKGEFKAMKDKIVTGIIIILMVTVGALSYNEINEKNIEKKNEMAKCNIMLSYARDQIRGTVRAYESRKKIVGKEIADQFIIEDLKNNSDMLEKLLENYKEQIDAKKTKTIIHTIGYLREYSEFISKDTSALKILDSFIAALDTTQKK